MKRFLVAPLLTATILISTHGQTSAQAAFPAPLPGQVSEPPTSSFPSRECADGYAALRADAEAKGKSIKAASDRRASADEACRLIGDFRTAEAKMFKYAEANVASCAIPATVLQQLKGGLQRTEAMQTKVCALAREMQKPGVRGTPEPTLGPGDYWPASPKPRT